MPCRSDNPRSAPFSASRRSARACLIGLASVAWASVLGLGGCGGDQSQVAVSADGRRVTVLTSDQRAEIRPININEGKAIAQKIARGETTVDRLNTEERRQLNAFMKVIRPARASE